MSGHSIANLRIKPVSRILTGVLLTLLVSATAQAGVYRRATGKPIKGRYIVTLKTEAGDPTLASAALQKIFGGRRLGIMQYAMKGFGIALNEQQARALSRHPFVAMVEEDEELELATVSSPTILLRRSTTETLRQELLANNCPWQGSYWMCTYSDANVNWFWHLNRLDNQGYINATERMYAYASTGAGVRAYVVDTGVYGTHQEFDTRVEGGANMTVDPDVGDA